MDQRKFGDEVTLEDRKDPRKCLQRWISWIEAQEPKLTPMEISRNKEERQIASDMSAALIKMQREPNEYANEIDIWNRYYLDYGRSEPIKDKIRRSNPEKYGEVPDREKMRILKNMRLWLEWIIDHGFIPNHSAPIAKGRHEAQRASIAHTIMKAHPDKYSEICEIYTDLLAHREDADLVRLAQVKLKLLEDITSLKEELKDVEEATIKPNKTVEKHFMAWKEWTIKHEITPSPTSQDNEERKVAQNMLYALETMKRFPDRHEATLKEYEQLREQYRRHKIKGKHSTKTLVKHSDTCKDGTIIHEITPSPTSQDNEERKVAQNTSYALETMKTYPDRHEGTLKEYEQLYEQKGMQYMRMSKTVEKHFLAWREWTIKHEITPSPTSQDNEERKVAQNMSYVLGTMRRYADRYEGTLKEYEQLYAQYGRIKDKKSVEEHFEAWKEWTLKHKITPAERSQDNEEKKVAHNMSVALSRMKKQPDKYEVILKEYEQLYAQYGRKNLKTLQQEKNSALTEVQRLKEQAVAAQEENSQVTDAKQGHRHPLPGDDDDAK